MTKVDWYECSAKTNPEEGGYYLCYYPSNNPGTSKFHVCNFHKGDNRWDSLDNCYTGKPSHWADLPDEPE